MRAPIGLVNSGLVMIHGGTNLRERNGSAAISMRSNQRTRLRNGTSRPGCFARLGLITEREVMMFDGVKQIKVTEGATGNQVDADMLQCRHCGMATFYVYQPEGVKHLHYQCTSCDTTFCNGGCDGNLQPWVKGG